MKKKPRSDSKLDSLSPKQKEELNRWLTEENVSYEEARQRVGARFGVLVSSDSTFSDYYHSVALPWKYARSRNMADEFAKAASGNFEPAAIKRIQQLLFESAATQGVDFKALKTLAKILGDSHKQTLNQERLELDKRKVKILEAKAALADQAKDVLGNTELTEEEKGARVRALFGMG
jgi:hypothetical protein